MDNRSIRSYRWIFKRNKQLNLGIKQGMKVLNCYNGLVQIEKGSFPTLGARVIWSRCSTQLKKMSSGSTISAKCLVRKLESKDLSPMEKARKPSIW
jgi:hypothetical protein